jgi:hypothetical protein
MPKIATLAAERLFIPSLPNRRSVLENWLMFSCCLFLDCYRRMSSQTAAADAGFS